MKQILIFFTVLLLFTSCITKQTNKQEVAINIAKVKVDGGFISGIKSEASDISVYKGIPFAAPPVGDLRWKAPQPVIPWDTILVADKFGPACPQIGISSSGRVTSSEDCLYLNVWTPATSINEKLPVMVWIHGGGFSTGATGIPFYNGENIAKKGVVVVSIAYRLGAFGFLAHPELSAENESGTSGNYGLMDQIAALKWIKNNIAAFGGNPDNVTIFGESAGGISVSMLCGSPLAKNLFNRAISESGGSFGPVKNVRLNGGIASLKGGEEQGSAFAERMDAGTITELRKIPADIFAKDPSAQMGVFWPICDGYVITDDQYKLYSEGNYNDVDILIGTNSDEGAMFINGVTAEQLKASSEQQFGPLVDKAMEVYPATNDSIALQSARNIFRETLFAWGTWAWGKLQTETGESNVYVYYFDQKHSSAMGGIKTIGALHADDINYVFGHMDGVYTDEDKKLSSIMMDYWVNFATSGDPNGEGLTNWPLFDESGNTVMYLKGNESFTGPVANRPQLEFMEDYFKWLRE